MSNLLSTAPIRLGVAILAAGASSRMGQPKLLLRWGAGSILEHLVLLWQTLGAAQIAVVCSGQDQAMHAELNRLGLPRESRILNPDPTRGMFSSVQSAARWGGWAKTLTHIAFVLGDQPHVGAGTLSQLLGFAAAHPAGICQPSRNARPRHPVIVSQSILSELAASTEPDLKRFLQARGEQVALREIDDPALESDLDTLADYQTALRTFGPHRAP